jgi:hypothetical protein
VSFYHYRFASKISIKSVSLVMDELTKSIQEKVPLCILFAADIVLVGITRWGLYIKLEIWQDILEHIECQFSKSRSRNKDEGVVRLDG